MAVVPVNPSEDVIADQFITAVESGKIELYSQTTGKSFWQVWFSTDEQWKIKAVTASLQKEDCAPELFYNYEGEWVVVGTFPQLLLILPEVRYNRDTRHDALQKAKLEIIALNKGETDGR